MKLTDMMKVRVSAATTHRQRLLALFAITLLLPLQVQAATVNTAESDAMTISRTLADDINHDLFGYLQDAVENRTTPLASRLSQIIGANFDLRRLTERVYGDDWKQIQTLGLEDSAHNVARAAMLHYLMQGLHLSGGGIADPLRVVNVQDIRTASDTRQRVCGYLVTPIRKVQLQMDIDRLDEARWVVLDVQFEAMPLTTLARVYIKWQSKGMGMIEFLQAARTASQSLNL